MFTLPDGSVEDEVIHVAFPHVAGEVDPPGSDVEVLQVVAARGEDPEQDDPDGAAVRLSCSPDDAETFGYRWHARGNQRGSRVKP